MTTSFRRPYVVMRRAAGAFVNGLWVDQGPEITITILATIQPARAVDYDQMQADRGGERIGRLVRVYSDTALQVADPRVPGQQADVLMYPPAAYGTPVGYRIIAQSTWQGGMSLDHYRYLAAANPEK